MSKTHLTLTPTEGVVTQAASHIFSAYIAAGLVRDGSEDDWIRRSVQEAVRIARRVDASLISNDEVG